jgi:uncharacterized protein YkwD
MLKPKPVSLYLLLLVAALFAAAISSAAVEPELGAPPTAPDVVTVQRAVNGSNALYLPLVATPPEPPLWVDTQSRTAVQQFYLTEYLASEGVDSGWTGHHGSCNPGTTTAAFQEAMTRRINYFRSMAGVPPIQGLDDTYNSKAQAAALMMSVNRALNHTPPPSWTCYSDDGYSGASSSNLYLGVRGPAAISGYIRDPGASNYPVGHRRWILYPQTRYMGIGDIPPRDGFQAANANWVFDLENMWKARPDTRESFVAWPPPGHVPYQVVYPRWSFSFRAADFGAATVSATRDGQPVGVTVSPVVNGYGENTLVWELNTTIPQPPGGDIQFMITIHNVVISGQARSFTYQTIVFDPHS